MKNIIITLFMGMSFLCFSSCAVDDVEYSYSIRDALKISAWVLDENLERNYGYWVEIDNFTGRGHWVLDESTETKLDSSEDDIFVFEQLKLDEVRTMAPLHYNRALHVNIFFEFDGIIEIETEDEYLLLAYDAKNPSMPWGGNTEGKHENLKWPRKVYVTILPLDEYTGKNDINEPKHAIIRNTVQIGKEYYLNVNAYKFDNQESPVIKAQLKLAVIEDKGLSHDNKCFFGVPLKEQSTFMSIELISYKYSDIYKIMDEIWDDEDD